MFFVVRVFIALLLTRAVNFTRVPTAAALYQMLFAAKMEKTAVQLAIPVLKVVGNVSSKDSMSKCLSILAK